MSKTSASALMSAACNTWNTNSQIVAAMCCESLCPTPPSLLCVLGPDNTSRTSLVSGCSPPLLPTLNSRYCYNTHSCPQTVSQRTEAAMSIQSKQDTEHSAVLFSELETLRRLQQDSDFGLSLNWAVSKPLWDECKSNLLRCWKAATQARDWDPEIRVHHD